jgi:hypothetical protein
MCAYFIEVTAPGELAVKSPQYPCSGASTQGGVIVPYMLSDAWPPEADWSPGNLLTFINASSATAENFKPYQWLVASVVHHLGGGGIWPTDTGSCGTFATSNFTSEAVINCVVKCTPGAASPFSIELSAHVYVFLDNSFQLNNGGTPYCNGWWKWDSSASFPLTSTCQSKPARQCVSTSDEFQVLDTPASVTADGTATSLGAYTANTSASYGDYSSTAQAIGEALRDALTATFRITSRRNCEPPVTCNCNASLGGMLVDLGNLTSASSSTPSSYQVSSSLIDFVWMYDRTDQTVSWQGPFGYYEYQQLDSSGPLDGDGNCTRRLWYQRAELYCDVIDGVAQWFVLFTSFRDIYDEVGISTHRSYDQWAGKIDCFKACEDLDNFIDEDEPVPMGEPYDIEYLGRTTVTGYLECEPPPRVTISFTQIITC